MDKINTIRDAVDAFRIFVEDRTGRPSDDFAYPPKLIYYLIQNYRNYIVFEDTKAKAKNKDDLSLILTLPCVEVREVDVIECPCAPAKGCTFYKSVHPIPKMITGLPLSVTSLDGLVSYDHVLWSQFKEKTSSRVEAQNREPKYTFRSINNKNHLYVYSSEKILDPMRIALTAYPKDPLEFYQFPTCGNEINVLCNPLDEELMVEDELVVKIFESVLRTIAAGKSLSTGADVINNDNNDSVVQA